MYKLLAVTLILIASLKIIGQNVDFKKNNFEDKEGLKQALENIRIGDNLFQEARPWTFSEAIQYYSKANDFNPDNALLNFKIGVCYLNTHKKNESKDYFLKAFSLNPQVDPKIEYAIAQAYHHNHEWDNAINYYKLFFEKIKKDKDQAKVINKRISECENGRLIVSHPVEVIIKNLGNIINSKYSDGAPLIPQDESMIVFTSRRKESTDGETNTGFQTFSENIYFSFREGESWTVPFKLGNELNTSSHDATVGLSFDGKTMFIYKGEMNQGDIYVSRYQRQKWSSPEPLRGKVNSSYQESAACLSPDGQSLYFVSYRIDDSKGQGDIFLSTKDENGEWNNITNLGSTINSEYDENGVFMHPDGKTLFFISNGHNTIGGYDIFKTMLQPDGTWSTPENLGFPINTTDDDMDIIIFGEEESYKGYFTSIRPDGFGEKDIYYFEYKKDEIVERNATADDTSSIDPANSEDIIYEDDVNDPSSYFAEVNEEGDSQDNKIETPEENEGEDNDINEEPEDEVITENDTADNGNGDEDEIIPVDRNYSTSEGQSWKTEDMSLKNVVFRVQVGASREQMPQAELKERYSGNLKVTEVFHEGWYKYIIGYYNVYEEAKELQTSCGTYDAWVVTQKNGIRVHIHEVIETFAFFYRLENFLYL